MKTTTRRSHIIGGPLLRGQVSGAAQPGVDEPALLAALMALGCRLDPAAHAMLTIAQAPGIATVEGATPDGDAIPLLAAVLHRMLQDQTEARKTVRRRLAAAGQRDWVGG